MGREATVTMMDSVDVVVIGGGIAGASAAWALAERLGAGVRLVEAESTLAYHTTGRSAAQLIENYGAAPNRALTTASLGFFDAPPDGLVDTPLLTTRGVLTMCGPGSDAARAALLAEGRAMNPTITEVDAATALALLPIIRPELLEAAIFEPQSSDIDVAGLHQAFVRGLRRAGASVAVSTRVDAATPDGTGWRVETTDGTLRAGQLVNAAGAWGDVVAARAGVAPVGLQPKRRTAFMTASRHPDSHRWPLLESLDHNWYLKPDGTQFMGSPADEIPSDPCDARPEELDIALAIDRINANTTLDIRSITSSWAGLRSFVADHAMVLGPDPEHPTFHWCVGQGGTGIQTSPGAGRLIADLLLDGRPGPGFDGVGLDRAGLAVERLR